MGQGVIFALFAIAVAIHSVDGSLSHSLFSRLIPAYEPLGSLSRLSRAVILYTLNLPFRGAGWEAVGLADLAARRKAAGPRLSAPRAEFVRFPAEPVEHVGDVFADAVSAVVRGVEVEVQLMDPIAFWRNGSPITPFQQVAHSRAVDLVLRCRRE